MKEMMQFWFKRVGPKAFLDYIGLFSKYSGVAKWEDEMEDREVVLTYRHRLGERWSRFTAACYGETLRRVIGVEPKIDVNTSQIVLRWNVP